MKDITQFINRELKPRLYAYIPQIFPELHFTRKGSKYISSLHADGTEGSGKKEDRSVITEKHPTKVFDNTRQEATDVITLFMQLNHLTEVWEAVNRLCSIVGIAAPEATPEAKERYQKEEKKRTAFEASAARQKAALFTREGSAALSYLHSRGWKDAEIKEAELGYISEAEAQQLNKESSSIYSRGESGAFYAQSGIGSFYTLSIPLRSGSLLYGFKVRTTQKDIPSGKDKYTYLFGTEKKSNLFNLTGIQQADGAITVVEGELDALHAQTRGVNGIVATGGGKLTEELLTAATARGIKRITLLFDKDQRGASFVRGSIDIAHKQRISVLVATLPEGESLSDGTPIHDIDEYLQKHSPEELQALIDSAISGSRYLLNELCDNFYQTHGDGNITDIEELELRHKVIALANHTPNEVERDMVINTYCASVNIDGREAFSASALRAVADEERAAQDAVIKRQETGKALNEAEALYKSGNVQAALQKMGEAAKELSQIDAQAKYSGLLALPTPESEAREEAEARARGKADIEAPYYFELGNEIEPLTLPSGGLTIVGALTSHGKSTFLRSLALHVAQNGSTGDTLYFTMEEEERIVKFEFTNTFIGQRLSFNNLRSIKTYENTGENFFKDSNLQTYQRGKERFREQLLYTGRLRVKYSEYYSQDLIEAIRYYNKQRPVKCVFVDYIQKLYEKGSRKERREELASIARTFEQLAIELQIPIVFAAQLNRDTKSPVTMCAQNIGESTNIEQSAAKVVFLWNSVEKAREDSKELKQWQDATGLTLGEGGALYARLAKNRGGIREAEAVLNFDGNTGAITQRKPTLQKVEEWKAKLSQRNAPEAQQSDLPFESGNEMTADAF